MSTSEEAIQPDVLRRWNLSAIREYLKRIWMAVQGEGDRGPRDYSEFDDERNVLVHIIKEQMKRSGSSGGVGNVNGHKHGWFVNAAVVVILGMSAWTLKETIENSRAIAVIQCQLNPAQCPQVVVRGQP